MGSDVLEVVGLDKVVREIGGVGMFLVCRLLGSYYGSCNLVSYGLGWVFFLIGF